MENSSGRLDTIIKVATPLLTLLTVSVGVYQFNAGQKENQARELQMRQLEIDKMNNQMNREILTKFKENQNKIYSETMSVVGFLATHKDYKSEKYQENLIRFNQLYWVELSSVATDNVNNELLKFENVLSNLQNNRYNEIDDKLFELQDAAEKVAIAIKESSMDYTLPGGLKGLEFNQSTSNKAKTK